MLVDPKYSHWPGCRHFPARFLAIDLIQATYEKRYEVAIIVSKDSGFGPAVELAKVIAESQGRKLVFQSAFPVALNTPKPESTDGRCEDSGRGLGSYRRDGPGSNLRRREVGGRSAGALGGTDGGLQWQWRARWQDRTRQEALADRDGASWGGRSVGRMTGQWLKGAVRLGVEWLAAGSGRG